MKFRVKVIKEPSNHPLNIQYTNEEFLNKKELLKLKRKISKDKQNHYLLYILSGQKEPLLFTERYKIILNKLKKHFTTSISRFFDNFCDLT